jgi:hypothetical protein
VLRAITSSAETLDKSVVMSSLIPSLKYSCSGSPLMFWNGSTQTETIRAERRVAGGCASPANAATLAASFFHPGLSAPPFQPLKSAHWIWLNGSGGIVPSRAAWMSVPEFLAVSASARTH